MTYHLHLRNRWTGNIWLTAVYEEDLVEAIKYGIDLIKLGRLYDEDDTFSVMEMDGCKGYPDGSVEIWGDEWWFVNDAVLKEAGILEHKAEIEAHYNDALKHRGGELIVDHPEDANEYTYTRDAVRTFDPMETGVMPRFRLIRYNGFQKDCTDDEVLGMPGDRDGWFDIDDMTDEDRKALEQWKKDRDEFMCSVEKLENAEA